MGQQLFYVGSYADREKEGIWAYHFDPGTARMERLYGISGVENPSFLTLNRERTRLYAVGETSDNRAGTIHAFAADGERAGLTPLTVQSTLGAAPCHVVLDQPESFIVVVNYNGGNLALFPVMTDGSVGPLADEVRHEGSGPRSDRQERPHPHASAVDPSGKFIIVSDLGSDKLVHYRLDRDAGKLIRHRETAAEPGAGPRHSIFHPNGRLFYVIGELDSTVAVYRFDVEDSRLMLLQTVSTLPASFTGENTSADIHMTSCGRFLYASNRGHDSIAVYRVDEEGRLAIVEHASAGGRTPRNFAITPDDRFLLAANQQSDTIVSFRIDPDSGRLMDTGHRAEVRAPVCIRFA